MVAVKVSWLKFFSFNFEKKDVEYIKNIWEVYDMNVESLDKEELKDKLEAIASRIGKEDLARAVREATRIEDKTRSSSLLSKQLDKIRILTILIKDYLEGNYRGISWGAIAAIAAVLLYILNPFDLIPDFIPVVGYSDDVAALMLLWERVSKAVEIYYRWKTESDKED